MVVKSFDTKLPDWLDHEIVPVVTGRNGISEILYELKLSLGTKLHPSLFAVHSSGKFLGRFDCGSITISERVLFPFIKPCIAAPLFQLEHNGFSAICISIILVVSYRRIDWLAIMLLHEYIGMLHQIT